MVMEETAMARGKGRAEAVLRPDMCWHLGATLRRPIMASEGIGEALRLSF